MTDSGVSARRKLYRSTLEDFVKSKGGLITPASLFYMTALGYARPRRGRFGWVLTVKGCKLLREGQTPEVSERKV